MNRTGKIVWVATVLLVVPTLVQAANRQIVVGALVEAGMVIVDRDYGDPAAKDKKTSDFTVSRLELHFDAQLDSAITGHVSLLYRESQRQEGPEDELYIDEINITLGDKQRGWYYTLGKMILPFGNFTSDMVTDPLAQTYAEIRETAFLAGYFQNGTYLSLYAFNGDTTEDPAGDDKAEHYGMSIGFASNNVNIGADYITSVGDSDFMQARLNNELGSKRFIAAAATHFNYRSKGLNFIVENIKTLDAFADSDFIDEPPPGISKPDRTVEPSINNFELGFPSGSATLTIGYQTTSDAVDLLPEKRLMIAFGREIIKGATLTVEYNIEEDYSVASGGSGDETNVISMQLAVTF